LTAFSGLQERLRRRVRPAGPERLESRRLLAAVTVQVGQVLRPVDPQLLGVNATYWDTNLNTVTTQQMVEAAGLNLFRLPGGSSSDDFHFNQPPAYQGQGTIPSMASFVASVGGQAIVTLDYGSGSPQEAAAMLAYLDAPVGATTPIGDGQEWNDQTGAWQTVDWQNAGYWAALRAAEPLPVDDGLNFMRLGRASPFGFDDFEVGNEVYGSWETDHHALAHDPATYVAFAKQFETFAAAMSLPVSIGIDAAAPDDSYNNWIATVLEQSVAQDFQIGFISDHNYVQSPGSENDATLLLDTVSDPASPYDWAVRAAGYTALINQYLGAAGKSVQLLTTEFNSVYSNPGKQTTSLVNGLFIADSLGALMETSYDGAAVWDLRNGWETGNNNSSSLYGWRDGGDYGLIGSPPDAPPQTGADVPYPSYFAEQLASKLIVTGGSVVAASSEDPDLSVYAVHQSDGDLALLVINKSDAGPITGQFQLSGFQPTMQANVWQYGEAQDSAAQTSGTGESALAYFKASLDLSGSSFSEAFPAYSMTVLDLASQPAIGTGPTITAPTVAAPDQVIGTTTDLSVSATDPAGSSSLTYTWSAAGPSPPGVVFSANGTNAAASTTASFSAPGFYTIQVIVQDASDQQAVGTVNVTVDQTLESISVSPAPATVVAGASGRFTASAQDQFGDAMAMPPGLVWSIAGGIGTVDPASGLYRAPDVAGSAVVRASDGGVLGTANVVVVAPTSTPPPTSVTPRARAVFRETGHSRSRFLATLTLSNTGITPIVGWSLQFDFTPEITFLRNAVLVSHVGSQYVIEDLDTDRVIAPGRSVKVTFRGTSRKLRSGPSLYALNGVPIRGKSIP
jgi:alpha-L-arabinofuranosidase